MGAGSVVQGPAEAHPAPGVEVGGVRDRQRRPVSEGAEHVMGEADVVHQGAEVRLEGAGLAGVSRAAERVVDGRAPAVRVRATRSAGTSWPASRPR